MHGLRARGGSAEVAGARVLLVVAPGDTVVAAARVLELLRLLIVAAPGRRRVGAGPAEVAPVLVAGPVG